MQIANTRVDTEYPLDQEKFPGSVRPPESAKLSREILLKGYTINGAKQLRWEHLFGSIEEGKLANFSIVSDNFFEVEATKIQGIKFEAVIFEGKVIHGEIDAKYK
jgi:predicted amidohydrolase YtcJ